MGGCLKNALKKKNNTKGNQDIRWHLRQLQILILYQ